MVSDLLSRLSSVQVSNFFDFFLFTSSPHQNVKKCIRKLAGLTGEGGVFYVRNLHLLSLSILVIWAQEEVWIEKQTWNDPIRDQSQLFRGKVCVEIFPSWSLALNCVLPLWRDPEILWTRKYSYFHLSIDSGTQIVTWWTFCKFRRIISCFCNIPLGKFVPPLEASIEIIWFCNVSGIRKSVGIKLFAF